MLLIYCNNTDTYNMLLLVPGNKFALDETEHEYDYESEND